jgi:hypothetical protein
VHGSGSLGTNVLGTGVGCLLCWAGIVPDINKIATEIRITLMLRLLQPSYGIATFVFPLFKQFHKRAGLASALLENLLEDAISKMRNIVPAAPSWC